MKKFTVKDFILYNSPCFNCKSHNNFYFEIDKADVTTGFVGRISKRAIVVAEYTEVELVVHYAKNLLIRIDHKTNKFTTTNLSDLTEYLKLNKLSMRLRCHRCLAEITTNTMDFNLEKMFVHPVTLQYETYIVKDNVNSYAVYSSYGIYKKSMITISKIANIKKNIHKAEQITLPLIPIYKFKTKEKFLNKMKTYVIFS